MNLFYKKIMICCVMAGSCCALQSAPLHESHKKSVHKKRRHSRKKIDTKPLTIQEKIEKIARSVSGQVGVSAFHIESGQHIVFHENTLMPMASVSKLAVALCCLQMVDEGKFSLDKKIALHAKDLWQIDRADERQLLKKKVVYRTIGELIALMMEVSDNPATDIILRLVGGVDKVNACLKKLGIHEMHLDRTILQLVCDYSGFTRPVDPYGCTNGQYRALQKKAHPADQERAEMKFYNDKRDTATPAAVTDLLHKLFLGTLLSRSSTQFLLDCMERSQMCCDRIGGQLPMGTQLMHKSGTMIGVTSYAIINDVGIITLPGNKGHIIISVFINKSNSPRGARGRAIAKIAQALYEHFAH